MTTLTITTGIETGGKIVSPNGGTLTATPTKNRYIKGTVLLPEPQTINMDMLGRYIIDLAPSTVGEWCWKLDYKIPGTISYTEHVLVPNQTTAEWGDLTHVNPDTSQPGNEPDPVWWGLLRNGLKSATPGPAGPQGEPGEPGETGERGYPGLRGITGETGPQGIQGERGLTGMIGIQGERGPIGATGATGARGAQGIQGERGATGDRGAQGIQGVQGIKGDTGIGWGTAIPITEGTSFNSYITPGIYSWENTNATDGPPVASKYGTMTVTRSTSGARLTQTFYPASSSIGNRANVFYQHIQLPGVVTPMPWVCYASQRVDNTAGKAIYTWDDTANREQLIYGDTGWRDITSMVTNGWTISQIKIRRTNYDITLNVYNIKPENKTDATALTMPPGYKPSNPGYGGNLTFPMRTVDNLQAWLNISGSNIQPEGSKNMAFGAIASLTWKTDDPWPAALPGTAAGIIPNT